MVLESCVLNIKTFKGFLSPGVTSAQKCSTQRLGIIAEEGISVSAVEI